MGAVDDDIESAFVKVDLHGLFANEANEIIQEYILPVLHVLKKMVIITKNSFFSEKTLHSLDNFSK